MLLLSRSSGIIHLVLLLSGLLWLVSSIRIGGLPPYEQIDPSLRRPPLQSEATRPRFDFEYFNQTYLVEPLYDFDISGLIVAHNNVGGITDAYHTSESVDLRDICVIWGDNFKDNIHQKLTFWSETWTCFYRYPSRELGALFRPDQLSNNHLLSEKEDVREKIRSARVGDQIRMRGWLVNYSPKDFPERVRKTSTVRTDTGNGACEVVLVDDFDIIKKWQAGWRTLNYWGWGIMIGAIILKLITFLIFPYIEYRSGE